MSNHLIEQTEPAEAAPPQKRGNKLTPAQILGIAALALFTLFITWQAKSLEKRMHARSEASALVNKQAADFSRSSLDD